MNRIKKLRKSRGLTQQQLSEILKVQRSTMSKYESESVLLTVDTIAVLTDYFGVSMDYLLCRTNEPNNTSNNKKGAPILALSYTEGDSKPEDLPQDEIALATIQPLSEDEKELLRIFRISSRRLQHEFMVKAYEFESREELEGDNAASDVG